MTRRKKLERGEIYWADLPPPEGPRPVIILTRSRALPRLRRVVVAPITSTVREGPFELPVGPDEGLDVDSAANFDDLETVDIQALAPRPLGRLSPIRIRDLDLTLRYALEIR